ncbi:MAG TPA: sigma 54-interacting transcriptional regulator, partial [Bacillota bacterium]|nr:sigma 54-interacting transcriptional regulator [Bacillota bacterium]
LRIGGDYILNIDARVIAATNHNLYQLVQKGEFREDLFFRINVLNLRVPPLRERKEDIPILVRHLLRLANQRHGTKTADITEGGMALLKEYNWPGNVRELENFAEKMAILAESPVIDERFIRQLLEGHAVYKGEWPEGEKEGDDCIKVKIGPLRDMELQLIEAVSGRVKGDKKALAERLGISRTTLWKRLKELEDGSR